MATDTRNPEIELLKKQNRQYQDTIKTATNKLAEQDGLLAALLAEPYSFGTVVDVGSPLPLRDLLTIGDLVSVTKAGHEHAGASGRVIDLPDEAGYCTIRLTGAPDEINVYVGAAEGNGEPPEIQVHGKDDGNTVVVNTRDHGPLSLRRPHNMDLIPGDIVKLSVKTMGIVDRSGFSPNGDVARVKSVLAGGKKVEVEVHGQPKVVFTGVEKVEVGDRVCLDPMSVVVIQKLPPEFEEEYHVKAEEVSTTWDKIGGCDLAKAELREAIEYPLRYPLHYAHYGRKVPRGALLYGPPGCGKTLLARATAHAVAAIHGAAALHSGFIYIKGPEVLKRYVGDSEETLRSAFVRGEKHFAKHGYPALLFIDEAEALFRKRGSGISSDITDNMVTTFLSEMSGIHESHVMVLLATNQPRMLDSAVLRDGRCDRHIKVPRPTMDDVPGIMDLYLKSLPLAKGVSYEEALMYTTAEIFNGALGILDVAESPENGMKFTLADCVSGAMIEGIVEKAGAFALARDIQRYDAELAKLVGDGQPDQESLEKAMKMAPFTGITINDLRRSVHFKYVENRDINHDLNLIDFAERHALNPDRLKVSPVPMPNGLAA